MKLLSLVASSLAVASVSAQQYAGDFINNSMPQVPGTEIAYFRIPDPAGKNNNLTLINYYSHGKNGKRIIESNIKRAVIVVHGLNRDPETYESNALSALGQLNNADINFDSVAVIAPFFANGDDKGVGYPWTNGLAAGQGSTTNALVWPGSQWSAGGNAQYPYKSKNTISSYYVLDTLVQYFDNTTLFPNLRQIVVAGHSLGAQTVHRYAAIGNQLNTKSPISYWIGNPNSYIWFNTTRPFDTTSCPTYDNYRDGYNNFTQYPMTYATSLVAQGRQSILDNFNSKQIAYARGLQDLGDDSTNCAPFTTGGNRNERFFNFIKTFPPTCPSPNTTNCDTIDFINVGHDSGAMMASAAGQARLFLDNFYGNHSRAYDFGYPRIQTGDDPFPDPSLNGTLASVNNNTYAGNMTYFGCYSDQNPATLAKFGYDNSSNSIEFCTNYCSSQNYSIAGVEYGSQCYCGSALTYKAQRVVESSCSFACSGNSTEICGGFGRISIFSTGTPAQLGAPVDPETIGPYYFSNCYTEGTNGRALSAQSTTSNSMSLETCANFCSAYKYFGTEFASECYCSNSIGVGSNVTATGECSSPCSGNQLELCGAANRLSVYVNPSWNASATTTATTPTNTATTPGQTASGISCPASNNTTYTSNGAIFQIECGVDHNGGDLSSAQVSSLQQCIDTCATTKGCVDVSLSGTACYMKSSLNAAGANGNVNGAKIIGYATASSSVSSIASTLSAISSSTLTSSVVSTSATLSSGSSTQVSSSTTVTSASAIPTVATCPGSNATTFTAFNGATFLIECGVDHQGGDMGMVYVNSFTDCITACANATACVDVSLTGTACYMKKALGAAQQNGGISGAKLLSGPVSSSSILVSSSVLASSTSSSSLITSGASSSVASSSTIASSAASSLASSSSTVSPPASSSPVTSSSSVLTASSASSTSASSTVLSSVITSSSVASSIASSSTSSSTTSSSASSSASSTAQAFSYYGCFVDNASRVLSVSNGSSSTNTPQQCASNCRGLGYRYSGVEYGSECYCSNTAPTNSAPDSDCSKPCSGDATQNCGGGYRLSVYVDNNWRQTFFARQSFTTWNIMGCYTDKVGSRTLPNTIAIPGGASNATIANCLTACQASNYQYCGAEYYSECYGSNTAPTASLLGTDALAAGCSYACSGNSTEACGGSSKITIYINNGTTF